MLIVQNAEVPSSAARRPRPIHPKVLLLAALAERFLPHVEAVVRPRAKAGIVALMHLMVRRTPEARELLATVVDGTAPAARVKAFAACGVGLRPMTVPALARKVDASIADAAESATFALVLGWLEVFGPPGQGTCLIDADRLDGSMLPPLDAERAALFRAACARAGMSVEEARDVLAAVRAGLPPGDVVPDEAALLIDAALISAAH